MALHFIQEQINGFIFDSQSFHVTHPVNCDAFLFLCQSTSIHMLHGPPTLRRHIPSVNFILVSLSSGLPKNAAFILSEI